MIRVAQPEEGRALLEASWAYLDSLYSADECHHLAMASLSRPEVTFFLAGDPPQGCAALLACQGYAEVKSMYVAPEARGAGLAPALMAAVEAEARVQGHPVLRLETGDVLHAAQALYRRHGFAVCGPFGAYTDQSRSVFMEKALQ